MGKICFNLLIFHGSFSLEVRDPKYEAKLHKISNRLIRRFVGSNSLEFNIRTRKFKYRLTRDILTWTTNRKLPINIQIQKLVQLELDELESNLKINRVEPKMNNLQGTISIGNCSLDKFCEQILRKIFEEFLPIQELRINQDKHESCLVLQNPNMKCDLVQNLCRSRGSKILFKDVQLKFITRGSTKEHSLTVKFQPNAREKTLHISFVATSFNQKYQDIYRFFEATACRFSKSTSNMSAKK